MHYHLAVRRSTFAITLLVLIALCVAFLFVRKQTPATHASGQESLSPAPAPQFSASQVEAAYIQGNYDEAASLIASYKSELMTEKVEVTQTGTVLAKVLALDNLLSKLNARVSVQEFSSALHAIP